MKYERNNIQLWQFIIMPAWWMSEYNDYKNRERVIQQIQETRGRYATLEILVKELMP